MSPRFYGGKISQLCIYYNGKFSNEPFIYKRNDFINLCRNYPELNDDNLNLERCLTFTGAVLFYNCNNLALFLNNAPESLRLYTENYMNMGHIVEGEQIGYFFEEESHKKLFIYRLP